MEWYEVLIRLLLAVIVGGVIGYEREFKNRPAGFRTHILVCVGAAVISMIQIESINFIASSFATSNSLPDGFKTDVGRMGAQVISGIGFLGAGTIIHEKGSVKGLTTAASLWVVACLGLGVGMGFYYLSIASSLCVVLVLVLLKKVEDKFWEKGVLVRMEFVYKDKREMIHKLADFFQHKGIKIKNIDFYYEEENESNMMTSQYTILLPRYLSAQDLINELILDDQILKINIL